MGKVNRIEVLRKISDIYKKNLKAPFDSALTLNNS